MKPQTVLIDTCKCGSRLEVRGLAPSVAAAHEDWLDQHAGCYPAPASPPTESEGGAT